MGHGNFGTPSLRRDTFSASNTVLNLFFSPMGSRAITLTGTTRVKYASTLPQGRFSFMRFSVIIATFKEEKLYVHPP